MTENVILWIASGLQTIALAWCASKLNTIDKLKSQLDTKVSELIDARMEIVESRIRSSATRLETIVEQMQQRMRDGNDHFDQVDEKNRRLELTTQQMVKDLDKSVSVRLEQMATKGDMQRMSERFTAFEVAMARQIVNQDRPMPARM